MLIEAHGFVCLSLVRRGNFTFPILSNQHESESLCQICGFFLSFTTCCLKF
uniref:Uncharacterized protein n=1 Tax=Rhizophora mucronata TaxID=61149 RepID=A0A2P2K2I0_RHIMU